MLEVKNLHFRHQQNGADILKGIDFKAHEGKMTTLLGPNGSGKTSLFHCLTGLWSLQKGEILFKERDISKISPAERAKIFAVVPQDHEPPFPYEAIDVVLTGRVSHVGLLSSPSFKDYRICEEALEMAGISHLRNRIYTKMSGGERQLVLIARALSQEAPILLLDEPTTHLDFRNQVGVLKKVRDIARKRGLTVLMTLHDPNLAMLFSDEAVMLSKGSVFCSGIPQKVITEKTLKEIYGMEVDVIQWNGMNFIYPRISA